MESLFDLNMLKLRLSLFVLFCILVRWLWKTYGIDFFAEQMAQEEKNFNELYTKKEHFLGAFKQKEADNTAQSIRLKKIRSDFVTWQERACGNLAECEQRKEIKQQLYHAYIQEKKEILSHNLSLKHLFENGLNNAEKELAQFYAKKNCSQIIKKLTATARAVQSSTHKE